MANPQSIITILGESSMQLIKIQLSLMARSSGAAISPMEHAFQTDPEYVPSGRHYTEGKWGDCLRYGDHQFKAHFHPSQPPYTRDLGDLGGLRNATSHHTEVHRITPTRTHPQHTTFQFNLCIMYTIEYHP